MQQLIRYKGLSLTPDEMAVENGALSLCGNLELHDGALRPSIITGTYLAVPIPEDTKLLYVHESSGYKHFIGLHQFDTTGLHEEDIIYSLQWFDDDGTLMDTIHEFSPGVTISSVNSIGNTLVIIASDGIHYALFKKDKSEYGEYYFLGQKPPFVELGFSVETSDHFEDYEYGGVESVGSPSGFKTCFQQTTYACSDLFNNVSATEWKKGDTCLNIKEDKQSDVTQSIFALVNRTNNLIARQGRFYANFFIRYCYRMFDGSMIMHSAPVFIPVRVPNNYCVQLNNAFFADDYVQSSGEYVIKGSNVEFVSPLVVTRTDKNGNKNSIVIRNATFEYYPCNVGILYHLDGDIKGLKEWGEIIKSIDVFITPPVTNIDTSEKISKLSIFENDYSAGRGDNSSPIHIASKKDDNGKIGFVTVKFPQLSDEEYQSKLKTVSSFYKICSLKVSELEEVKGTKELPIDKAQVYQISLQEQMKDDYKTHNQLFAKGSYVYNHRLNLYGVQEKLTPGFSRVVMFPYATFLKDDGSFAKKLHITKIVTVLNTTSGTKYVEKVIDNEITEYIEDFMIANLPKFYPDSRAEKMVIFCEDGYNIKFIYAFDLEACEELNGAIHMGDFSKDLSSYRVSSFDYSVDDVVDLPNKIYTSESDNAFYYPVNAINTVGIGTIMGIASTTRALSQGQFGQYPLMAFSTDGIWALNVSAQGTYSSIHPISREVCSNPSSITQLDQSVAFVTNRSFSRVAESQVVSMSDVLDGPCFDLANNLSAVSRFFTPLADDSPDAKEMKEQIGKLMGFSKSPIDFFQRCQVVYDYKNSRIICLNVSVETEEAPSYFVALVYSVRDDSWSTMLIKNVLTVINSYPHPYIQFKDGNVLCLDQGYDYDDKTPYNGIIVTRTLKFDEDECPDAITGYIHSLTTDAHPMMWVFGSNDNQTWHYLGLCGGMKAHYMASKGFRYFRLAIYLRMKSASRYMATRLDVVRRFGKF